MTAVICSAIWLLGAVFIGLFNYSAHINDPEGEE